MNTNYPGNSFKDKNKQEKKRFEKITDGKVLTKKKSPLNRLISTFIAEDITDVKNYLIEEVAIPYVKDAILDGMEMLLTGKTRGRTYKNEKKTNYSYISSNPSRNNRSSGDTRRKTDFNNLIFETRAEAEEVLSRMIDALETFQVVSIADLYDLCGVTGEITDYKWGWENLSSADVKRDREGYILNLPKPIYLD